MVPRNILVLLLLWSLASFFACTAISNPGKRHSNPGDLGDLTQQVNMVQEPKKASLNVMILTISGAGHMTPLLALGEELVRRGHNVTFVMTIDPAKEKSFMGKVRVRGMRFKSAGESVEAAHVKEVRQQDTTYFTAVKMFLTFVPHELATIAKFVDGYLSANSVDIIVGEDFMEAILQCIGTQRNIKTVIQGVTLQYKPHSLPHWPWPGFVAGSISDNLTFLQRLELTLVGTAFQLFYKNVLMNVIFGAIQDYCPGVTLSQATAAAGIRIPQIVPSVIGFEYPRTISPLTTYVGPVLTRNPDPISTHLLECLDSKEEKSVVYVSMGSNVPLSREKGDAILNGVLSTDYSLLWSLRESNRDILDGVELDAKRVYLSNWTPQLAVLGHRAIRVAIVHGGMNGIHESLYNEVPLIVLPYGADQMANAGRVHHQGLGIHLQDSNITAASVAEAIKQIDEGAYRENIRHLKKSFIEGGGRERAAELVEFYGEVGYSHLIPAYAKYDWSWVQYYDVDVYLVLTLLLSFSCFLALKCCQYICKFILCKMAKKQKSD